MELADLASQVNGFDKLPPREKIQLFAWWLHAHQGKEMFANADIRWCYDKLHLPAPNVPQYVTRMANYRPADLIKVKGGYKLERAIRLQLDAKYGVHQSVMAVSKLLADLPGKIPNPAERIFLTETIDCYRMRAYRACIVMTWNLTYGHLLNWIVSDSQRLAAFNAAVPRRYPKKTNITIKSYDDFGDHLTEREAIEIIGSASLVNSNIMKILRGKLDRRNSAAHPSSVIIVQSQADDMITDLVNNVVLALN